MKLKIPLFACFALALAGCASQSHSIALRAELANTPNGRATWAAMQSTLPLPPMVLPAAPELAFTPPVRPAPDYLDIPRPVQPLIISQGTAFQNGNPVGYVIQ